MDTKSTFEDFLKEKHAQNYQGLDDDMPDAYEAWVSSKEPEELKKLSEEYLEKIKELIK